MSKWENPGNWSCGTVADENSNVFITRANQITLKLTPTRHAGALQPIWQHH